MELLKSSIITFLVILLSSNSVVDVESHVLYMQIIKGDDLHMDDGYISGRPYLMSKNVNIKDGDTVYYNGNIEYFPGEYKYLLRQESMNTTSKRKIKDFNKRNSQYGVCISSFYHLKLQVDYTPINYQEMFLRLLSLEEDSIVFRGKNVVLCNILFQSHPKVVSTFSGSSARDPE